MIDRFYSAQELKEKAKNLYACERNKKRLDGWFLVEEIYIRTMKESVRKEHILKTSEALRHVVEELPIYLDDNNVFAGSPRDAFARSYALINPNFKVSTFEGYCIPTDAFNDIESNETYPQQRIERAREEMGKTDYIRELTSVYDNARIDTEEVAYFVEQVTAHVIPDFRLVLEKGVLYQIDEIQKNKMASLDHKKRVQYTAMQETLNSVLILAERYAVCAEEKIANTTEKQKEQWTLMRDTLRKIPRYGADTLYEAIQSYILLWQVMCLEQTPNPSAFSVGNADRIFEPYRAKENLTREYAAGLFGHFLTMFNVGDRSWAVSQNVLIGGMDLDGKDLTNESSYALLDAFYIMNLPQPILSVRLHPHTPERLYWELGRFFFTPGRLTPSFFNDESVFKVLKNRGVDESDIVDYAVAGCQEPLIMGKDNGNTTNSWLNLAKILELALNDGKSILSGKQIGPTYEQLGISPDSLDIIKDIRRIFNQYLDYFIERMVRNANGASIAIAKMPVPFLSCFMGGVESGIDMRDNKFQGTKYNGSGCLIHGLTVIADSFVAMDNLANERPQDAKRLFEGLQSNFEPDEELRQYLFCCEKFGNNSEIVDAEAAELATTIADKVSECRNYLNNPFRPDFATPSTHLIYGNHVAALPNGRKAKEMLNYGVDPLYGEAQHGLGYRILSLKKLPFEKFVGGYASHLGLDPNYFRSDTMEEKGMEFNTKIIKPLFFSNDKLETSPFYLYVNVTTPEILRKVLEKPQEYAPSGIYIVRIHGTFVNFLDLSPEIQSDIIKRLDLKSTVC